MKLPVFRLLLVGALLGAEGASAQSILRAAPQYERYQQMREARGRAVKSGALAVQWKEGGQAFEFEQDGQRFRYHVRSGSLLPVPKASPAAAVEAALAEEAPKRFPRPDRPARGRQFAAATSPDGQHQAFYRDRNLWLRSLEDTNEVAVTRDGSEATRVKYGTATWTYGEELDQNTAIWWSSDNRRVAFYRFDETGIPDYHVVLDHGKLQTRLLTEPYPKAGGTNPVVDLLVYDRESGKTVPVDVRSGRPFVNDVPGHYVYGVRWSPDGRELLFFRTDRLQKVMELCAADPETGACRVVIHEEWPPSWVENSPTMQFLEDGKRFIWSSERTGWKNYYLYDLEGKLHTALSGHPFEVAGIVRVDEARGEMFYLARSGDNHMKVQLHRVGLDGKGDRRLTDPGLNHRVSIAPDGAHFVDVAQTHRRPPTTTLRDREGGRLAELATSDLKGFRELGLREVELFTFRGGDGVTMLHGMLHFPSQFNPRKKYPLLVSVYAGPATAGAHEQFGLPHEFTELGFLVASFDSRTVNGRGKRLLDSCYRDFGRGEMDDQAAGVEYLSQRRYVDRERVGIFGTSYGGTAAAMCLLRFPHLFKAASASAPVADFRQYDTIYTERYLGLPQEGQEVYDAASLLPIAGNLEGHLQLFFGTADDNVHPSNGFQFADALVRAGKRFELEVGVDVEHASIGRERMLDFFLLHLGRAR